MCKYCVKTDFNSNSILVIGDGEILTKFYYCSYEEWFSLIDLANELVKQLKQGFITKEEIQIRLKV